MANPKAEKKTTKKTTAAAVEVSSGPAPAPMYPAIVYNVADNAIAELREKYTTLKTNGVEDKTSYQAVDKARLHIRSLRAEVEKTRKGLKERSLEYGREVDAEAKRLTALLEEVETPLLEQKKIVDDQIEAEAARVQAAKDAKAKERESALADVGVTLSITEAPLFLYSMTDEDFAAKLDDATFAYNTQKEREAEKEAELNHLREQEAARQEKERKEQEAEKTRVAEERRKLDEEKAEFEKQQREAKAEQDKKDAEERGRKEAEAKAARDAEAAAAAETERQAREEREAAAKPDKDKMAAYLDALRAVPKPTMETEDGKAIFSKFNAALRAAALETIA